MPIRYVQDTPNSNDVEKSLEKLDAEFPGWDFWWSPSFGVRYCAGRTGELGSIHGQTPEVVAEKIRQEGSR